MTRKTAQKTEKTDVLDVATVEVDDPRLPQKSWFRIDEAAMYFDCSESCIRNWISHGHLDGAILPGGMRVSRESILLCRFKKAK